MVDLKLKIQEEAMKRNYSKEEILVSKINVPYPAGTGWISIVVFYQGLFFTNKRAFLFGLNYKYEEVEGEKLKIFDLDDVEDII